MAILGIFVFLLLRLAPGDPAAIIAGPTATPEMIAGIHEKLAPNDPMPVQFTRWVRDILGGDFGTSIFAGRPVLELISASSTEPGWSRPCRSAGRTQK